MNTSLDENQAMLADSARRYVERGYTADTRAASLASAHGCAAQRWRELADMGWLALALPEDCGGLGGSVSDLCVLAEELGHAPIVEPWIACGVMAAGLLVATGNAAQRAQWLPALADGSKRIAFAAWEEGSRFDATQIHTRARLVDGVWRLAGSKEFAPGAPGADAVIVAALCEEPGGNLTPALFLVDPVAAGCETQPYAMVDGRHAAHLRLDNVAVAAESRLDGAADVRHAIAMAIDAAVLVSCAETTGAMARSLQITLDYLKTRKQFGRIVASNQALQHRLVDLHVSVEETRALVHAAAGAFAGPALQRQRQRHVAAAKAYASQAARLMWEETVQMHGAIGMTDEYMLGRYVRHMAASHALFGDADHHLERMAEVDDQLYAMA